MNDEATAGELPRETSAFFGHTEAEQALLSAYKSGRVPHAWLLGGEPGIGKATLAYRFARFVLTHPDPRSDEVQRASSLAVDPEHLVARRIAAQAESSLLPLERVINPETGKLFTVIRVEDVRRSVSFFGSTAAGDSWRIAIVDTVDDLNAASANALLKILEEPPQRALLLLVSNSPGQELSTIRSRCRRLLLRPLNESDVLSALVAATDGDADDPETREATQASGGSVGRALAFLEGDALSLRGRVLELLAQLPDLDQRALHALSDALGTSDPQRIATFIDLVNGWLSQRLGAASLPQQARLAETWDRVNTMAQDADSYNLERKPLVFSIFAALSQAAAA